MRCVIARYPFELTKNGVLALMRGVTPELVTAESVTIGRRRYPVKQVGQIITRQDRRDFTGEEVVRAMTRLGFTCHHRPEAAPAVLPTAVRTASALLGGDLSVGADPLRV
ncbi:SCO5918 family protein [Streptomyces sp. URMC 126]|uniref:SCO5918 family protein n=1 Tax=Streptomyces sp. URMC 126 TaxID=3423401 RepID=UPI003F1AB10A